MSKYIGDYRISEWVEICREMEAMECASYCTFRKFCLHIRGKTLPGDIDLNMMQQGYREENQQNDN